MNNIIRTVPATFAALFAATATITANAADGTIYWKGGSGTEAEPADVYNRDNWTADSSYSGNSITQLPAGQHNVNFATNSFPDQACCYLTNSSPNAASGSICEEMCFHTGNYSLCGSFKASSHFYAGYDAGKELSVAVNGGSVTVGGALYVGYSGNGTLTINGGTVEVNSSKLTMLANNSGSSGTINLNGGVLKTPRIANNKGTGCLNFNGGTLQANAAHTDFIKSTMTVMVDAGGGTIHCGGNAVSINATLGGTGGLNFTGGNTITVNNISYPGITTITPGTRLAVWNWSASKKVISNGIVVAGVPAQGDVIFTCTRGTEGGTTYTLDGVSLDNVTCPLAPTTTFALDESKTNIVVTHVGTSLDNYWTGNAGDNNLSTAGNWSHHVPVNGENANIFVTNAVTLTNSSGFAPSAITFLGGCSAVTINGDDLIGIVAITNNSASSHTINAKVYFVGNIQVKQAAMADRGDLTKAHVTFAGGAYAAAGCSLESGSSAATYSRCIFGKYYLANISSSPWTAGYNGSSRVCVADGSYLYVPYAGNLNELYVASGAKVEIGDMEVENKRLSCQVKGEMVVTNLTMNGNSTQYVTYGQGTSTPGVFKFGAVTNKVHNDSGALFYFADQIAAGRHVFYIGEGGMHFDTSRSSQSSIYVIGRSESGNHETIRPWYSDFTIGARPGAAAGLRFFGDVEFCTDDENGTGRTITLEARTQVQANKVAAITVSGTGTLKVTQPDDNGAQPTVTLTDSATLEYASGATLGTGEMTLGAGTTLALTATSGTFTALSNAVTLPTGENKKAKIRIDGHRLPCGNHTILSNVTGSANNVEVDLSGTALDGRKRASFSVDGTNLVLTINPNGTVIFVR